MFSPQDTPRVFALPLGVDFAGQFVVGLHARMAGQPPEAWARVQVYVNTRRSARRLEELLSVGGAMILPDIRVITALASDRMVPLSRAIPPLRRRLVIARLVAAYLDKEPNVAPESAVFDLADSLGDLLDSFSGEGLATDALAQIDVEDHSEHWARSLRFLEILSDYWNAGRDGLMDGEERQRAAAEFYAREWEKTPPDFPVIVAGSTGSRGATAVFMEAVANLPQGAVVLPGYDYDMPASAWEAAGIDHPQYGFKRLRERIGFGALPVWQKCARQAAERNRLVSLALRPAPVTDQWLSEGPALAEGLPDACAKMTLIEASSSREEAEAIAVRLRQAAEVGQSAALVSPDRMLTRRVTSVLSRWGIVPDDSAGQPLPLTPPGIFLRRVIGVAGKTVTPGDLLAILKHPLCGGTEGRGRHLAMTRRLELDVLRGGPPLVDWDALAIKVAEFGDEFPEWIAWLRDLFLPLESVGSRSLDAWLRLHRTVGMGLSGGTASEAPPLAEKNAGRAVLAAFDALALEADAAGALSLVEYRALFQSVLMQTEVHEDAFLPHPNIAILGTLEARVQSADLVVLGGLNEGIWPKIPEPDPWLSRNMRTQIGLPLPERQIGLSAHDFQQAIAAPEVVLTRSIRDGEAQTMASRWVIRLVNLMDGLDSGAEVLAGMRGRGAQLLALATAMNRPDVTEMPAVRPAPSPPIDARPKTLSVTRIEALIRDPYAIYADKVLRLRKLDPIGREPDALERGTALHKVMEAFLAATMDGLPEDAEAKFIDVARRELAVVPWPSTQQFWVSRLEKIAPWFIATERARRRRGTPHMLEVAGRREAGGFTLTATADRIDLTGGGAAIYDYKSGSLPSIKQVKTFAVQLPLEGAIAQAGGFEGIDPVEEVYLQLIGLGSGGKELALDKTPEEIDAYWTNLLGLIAAYGSRALGYSARSRTELISFDGDYDHLSRYGEWQDGDPFDVEEVG